MDYSDEQENDFEQATSKNELYQNSFSTKDFLLIEAERFAVSIKHFYKIGILSKEDYEYLRITIKMIGSFLASKFETNDRFKEHYQMELHEKIRKIKAKTVTKKVEMPDQLSLFNITKPIPITGEIAVTGLNENLQALKTNAKDLDRKKFPYKIPSGTNWEHIIIKFLDDKKIEILVKRLRHIADFKELGMVGKGKVPEPSEQWYFLKVLAQCNGEISIKDPESKEKYKKQKQLLSESLRNYFSIDYDPFFPYQSSLEKSGNSYKIKITLIPPPKNSQIKEQEFPKEEEKDILGISDFFDEVAPQVFEE